MEQIHDLVAQKIAEMRSRQGESTTSGTTDGESGITRKVRGYNALIGEHGADSCPKCLGRGDIAVEVDGEMQIRVCECEIKRRCLARIRRSGLGELYNAYRMDNYATPTDWQKHLKDKAVSFLANDSGWLFVCGNSGSGKSHLTCAVARELLEAGRTVRYLMWRHDAPQLKAMVNEREEYEKRMEDLARCDVLVIDDLFKGKVTDADINLAFELLNARYNAPSKRTIISSEKAADDILRLDEAIGSRIIERAIGFLLQTEPVNLRLLVNGG